MFSMSPHAEQSGCQAVFHSGLKEFPWPSYAKKSADLSAEGDGAIWVRDCAAAAENILPGHDAVRIKGRRLYGVVQLDFTPEIKVYYVYWKPDIRRPDIKIIRP